MKVTISAHDHIENFASGKEPAYARVYADRDFQTTDNESVGAGALDSPQYVKQVSCTYSAGVTTIASFATTNRLDSTVVTASRLINASYTLALYTAKGKRCAIVYSGILIPDTLTPTTWTTLYNYSTAPPQPYRATYYTAAQVDTLLNGLSLAPNATDVIIGKSRLSYLQVSLGDPIAVGNNDPIIRATRQTVYLETYGHTQAGLTAALIVIGNTQTELKITSQVSITSSLAINANVLITFEGNGSFTVATGQTLTINSLTPPAPYQVFFGLGSVVLGKNAVDEKNLAWWAGNSSTADLTSQFGQMFTNGGRCFVPAGVWKCTNVTIPSYITLRGASAGADATTGTAIQLFNLAATSCVLKASEAFRFISLQDLTISTLTSTSASGFIAEGTAPNTALYLKFDNVTFYGTGTSAPAQFWLKDLGGTWQLEEVNFNHCAWVTPASGRSFTIESPNTSVYINQGQFGGGANFTAVYGYYIGFLKLTQCQAAGVGLSAIPWNTSIQRTITQASITSGTKDLSISTGAFSSNDIGRRVLITGKLDSYIDQVLSTTTAHVHDNASATATNEALKVYEYTENTARGNTFVHIVGPHNNIHLDNCVDEGMNYFLKVDASDLTGVIQMTNCWPQARIQLNQSCSLSVTGCHLFSQLFYDGVAAAAGVVASGNYIDTQVVTVSADVTLVEPTFWGVRDGVSVLQTDLDVKEGVYRQTVGMPTRFSYGQEHRFAPKTSEGISQFVSSIDTSGGPHIKLIEYGRSDTINEAPLYTYKISRDFDTGFSITEGTQTKPNAGWQYNNGPVQADTFVGSVVTPATITTDAGTYYIADYKQNVRMASNADHTIGGLNFPAIVQPGTDGNQVQLWNVGSFKITFLHQSGGASANERFICDTGANIVCGIGEKIYAVRDGTTARWRISKGNISGVTGDGTNVNISRPVIMASTLEVVGGTTFDGNILASGTTQLAADTTLSGGSDLIFVGTTGQSQILMTDNLANALQIGEAANAYLTFKTSNGAEQITASKALLGISPTAGVGYGTGSGSTVVQGTSRTTAVVINTVTGNITLFSAAGSATPASFTVTNSSCLAADTVIVSQKSGTDKYAVIVSAVAAGSFQITFWDVTGTTTETPVFNYTIVRGSAS